MMNHCRNIFCIYSQINLLPCRPGFFIPGPIVILRWILLCTGKKVIRRKYDSATSCLHTLHWLPVEQRVEFKVLCLVYKALHSEAPEYLQEMFNTRTSAYTTRSISAHALYVPRTHTKSFGSRAFSHIGAKLWNELPINIQNAPSFIQFKKELKTYLFQDAFN